ncbi:EscS/YscS/HrcS family type III secretion system export apparatus protein [Dyella sp. M7H15-1]|uniref:type III secretion system export apparatus subunit SctS n=1 Tax=Dyella sp. M7H15-1 TaxID=2501295 RepID=UPI0010050519|nr:type III secretion system export apparatus subunit SctS [Dyella sp. M7H15-1]QAU24841.1 EscS/YscS/HrcS family type III secretion system export apparatus protein [Dyella sp. M7H15-1]
MGEALIIHLASELLWLVLLLSLPIVVVASVVGLLVSLVQALTQVQDQTVPFLLKLVAACITLVATYHWMGGMLLRYTNQSFDLISQMGS